MTKIAFVFPGQGSQKIGMGQDVATKYTEAAAVFNNADKRLGYSLSKLIQEGPMENLTKSENAQPALVATSTAILRVIEAQGIKADYVAGHSLGEYSALVAGGYLTADDAIYLVHKRGQLMEEAVPNGGGAMAAVLGLDRETLEKVTEEITEGGDVAELANLNCPGQIVISGSQIGIEKAAELAKTKGAKRVMPLAVSGPFHSSLMKPASDAFKPVLKEIKIQSGKIPVVANVNAAETTKPETIEANLVKQIYSPVLWEDTVRYLLEQGVSTFVEIGAGKVLAGLIKKISRDVTVLSAGDEASLETVIQTLKGE